MTPKEYKAVLDAGCGWEPSGGEDTDGDCGHAYEWDCDHCPIVEERYKRATQMNKATEECLKTLRKDEILHLQVDDEPNIRVPADTSTPHLLYALGDDGIDATYTKLGDTTVIKCTYAGTHAVIVLNLETPE